MGERTWTCIRECNYTIPGVKIPRHFKPGGVRNGTVTVDDQIDLDPSLFSTHAPKPAKEPVHPSIRKQKPPERTKSSEFFKRGQKSAVKTQKQLKTKRGPGRPRANK